MTRREHRPGGGTLPTRLARLALTLGHTALTLLALIGFRPLMAADDLACLTGMRLRSAHERLRELRLMRMRNTLRLDECWVSAALLDEVRQNPRLAVLAGPGPLAFDGAGNLVDLAHEGGKGRSLRRRSATPGNAQCPAATSSSRRT